MATHGELDLKETELDDVDWIYLALNSDQWRALVHTVMNCNDMFLQFRRKVFWSRFIAFCCNRPIWIINRMLVQLHKIPQARHLLYKFTMQAAVWFKQRLAGVTFDLEFSDPNNRTYCSRWFESHTMILLRQAECNRLPSSLLVQCVFNCERFYVFLCINVGSLCLNFHFFSSGT